MTLPVPEDGATNEALFNITGGSFYLGITDTTVEGDFRNIYTNTTITFSAWNNVSLFKGVLLDFSNFLQLA